MKGWTEKDIQNLNVTNSTYNDKAVIYGNGTISELQLNEIKGHVLSKSKHPEFTLQKQLCQFIRTQHPNVLFLSDTVASVKLSYPQQGRNKAIQNSSFHCPDLMILEPRGKFSGLFLELKVKSPFKADGTLYKNEHLQNQFDTLTRLNERGYKALFVWSLETAMKIINDYLKV